MAEIRANQGNRHALSETLLVNIKSEKDPLDKFVSSFEKSEPEFIYRFYHQSFKVFGYKELIQYTVQFLEKLAPEFLHLNEWYQGIIDLGLAKDFTDSTNDNWLSETQPLLEAFWHTKFFVTQMKSSAASLETAPKIMPYDWAAVLYLYDLR